jgi:hypothetical protein
MPVELFGFSFGRKKGDSEDLKSTSFVSPNEYDGAITIDAGGVLGTYIDFTGGIKDENHLIGQYRSIALFPEVDNAIEDIINDAIVMDDENEPVKINLDNLFLSENIKEKISSEFDEILNLMQFDRKGHDIFRRWYIDSKLYFHIMIDEKNPMKGIRELRAIDPVNIKRIKKIQRKPVSVGLNQVPAIEKIEDFYIYTNRDKDSTFYTTTGGLKITPDSICYIHSGIIDSRTKRVVGYLQKAIRPTNMLRQIEDAVVIYRISRAPERRIFYVDVGNLPKNKAEQYVRSLMNRYRNKLTYDADTGVVRDDRRHMHMLEDYWLPRREGGRGTEIQTLSGGENLGEMADVLYLLSKVYTSLNIPLSRMEAQNGFNMGRSAEITRDEVKFSKFISRIRARFSELFLNLLKVQLLLKGIMGQDDWDEIAQKIKFTYNTDSYFGELKDTEIFRERLQNLAQIEPYIGKYFSSDWVRKHIIKQTPEEIKILNYEIQQELQQQPQPEEEAGEEGEEL